MIDLATTVLTGTGMAAGAGVLLGHAWRSQRLASRFEAFAARLRDVETIMYTHDEPTESMPLRAPDFTLPGLAGTQLSLDRLLALGKPVLLVFADPTGETGTQLLTSIGQWQEAHDAPLTVVGIAPARAVEVAPPVVPPGITDLLVQNDQQTASAAYGIALTPAVVLIRPNGALVGTPTVGVRGIQSLLASVGHAAAEATRIRQERIESDAPAPGTKAPLVLLPDVDDVDQPVVTTATPHLLLFWSSDCGYCEQLVPDLRVMERTRPPDAPTITLVARGSEAANRAQGFGYRTLFDHDLSASTAFGVIGTPAAILVDAHGVVVSPIARGIRSVRELLGLNGHPLSPHPDADQ